MKQKWKLTTIGSLLFVITFIYACGSTQTTKQNVPVNTSPTTSASQSDEFAAARDIYKTNCSKCHRDNGVGGKITIDGKELDPRDLTSDKMMARPEKKLFEDVSEGSPDDGMPAFRGKLTENQIDEVVRYIRGGLQRK